MHSKGSIPRVCETCGGAFLTWPSKVLAGKGRWCSKACYDAVRALAVQGRTCDVCGKDGITSGSRFCSIACRAIGMVEAPEERFWRHVDKSSTTGCWLWTGGRDAAGYGTFNSGVGRRGPLVRASRFALILATGRPIPDGKRALHTCDNPPCVRNDDEGTYEVKGVMLPRWGHLFLGTQTNNVQDMHAKGRYPKMRSGNFRRGSDLAQARLTESDIPLIRAAAVQGESRTHIARRFGVARATVRKVLEGETWQHVH